MVHGEELSGSTKTGLDVVGDEQDAVLAAPLAQAMQKGSRRIDIPTLAGAVSVVTTAPNPLATSKSVTLNQTGLRWSDRVRFKVHPK